MQYVFVSTDYVISISASNYAGFGLIDAYGLVSLAVNWTTVAPQLTCTVPYLHIDRCVSYIILSGVLISMSVLAFELISFPDPNKDSKYGL